MLNAQKEFHFYSTDVPEPRSLCLLRCPLPLHHVQYTTHVAAFVPSVNVAMPEVITTHTPSSVTPVLPTTIHISTPVSAPAIALVLASGAACVPELLELDVHNKEKLPREREEMGFRSIDLNKEILRQHNYNLEQYVASMNAMLSLELEEMVRHASALFCIVSAT